MHFSAKALSRAVLPPLAGLGAVLAASALASEMASDVPDLAGAELWSLRPTRGSGPVPVPAPVLVPMLRGAKAIPLSDLPGERHAVRIVYQGYGPAPAASER